MQKLSEVNIKLKEKLSETNKIIQSFNMPLLEVVQSKRGKIVLFDNFRYTINKKLLFQFIWNVSTNVAWEWSQMVR